MSVRAAFNFLMQIDSKMESLKIKLYEWNSGPFACQTEGKGSIPVADTVVSRF